MGGDTLRTILTGRSNEVRPVTGGDPGADGPGPTDALTSAAPGPRVRRRSAVRPDDGEPVLPDTTRDERDLGWGDPPERNDDERLLREVPPHHGG